MATAMAVPMAAVMPNDLKNSMRGETSRMSRGIKLINHHQPRHGGLPLHVFGVTPLEWQIGVGRDTTRFRPAKRRPILRRRRLAKRDKAPYQKSIYFH